MAIDFKAGDTFIYTLKWNPGLIGPVNLAGATITSAIKLQGGAKVAIPVTLAADNLSFTAMTTADTAAWANGAASWDAKVVLATGVKIHSTTIAYNVISPIT